MWIRSQDKELLRNVNSIEIIKYEGAKYTTIEGDGWHLGAYSSREKALKVLNEIRNELNDTQYYEIENKGHGMYTLNTGIRVYTMPDDEDVEA